MTTAGNGAPVVLVAPELRSLAEADRGTWPGGGRTLYGLPGEGGSRPEDGRVAALMPLVSQPVGRAQLDRYPRLRVIANYGVGYDNIDLAAAAERDVVVTNTPDVLTDATADLAMALLLAAARRLREGLALAMSGTWEGWHPTQLLGTGLQGRALGILGAGRIGRATARRARAFGMEILYWDRSGSVELETELGARRIEDLGTLLSLADAVSVHLPLAHETRGLIDAGAIGRMRRGAILVNTARGSIVDERALEAALRDGRLGAAGLDVFAEEPGIPVGLRELPNCFVLPHLGSATRDARAGMWDLAARNVRAVLAGREPETPVR